MGWVGIGEELGDDGRFGDDLLVDAPAAVCVADGGDGSALLDRGEGSQSWILCWLLYTRRNLGRRWGGI